MEILNLLECRIKDLIFLTKKLQDENQRLEIEKMEFEEKISHLEDSLLKESENNQTFFNEKVLATRVVDDLISDIDKLVRYQGTDL